MNMQCNTHPWNRRDYHPGLYRRSWTAWCWEIYYMKGSTNSPFQSLSSEMSHLLVIWQIIVRGGCSALWASMCVPIRDNSRRILGLLTYSLEIEGLWTPLPELHNLITCAQTAAPRAVCLWRLPWAQGWGSAVTPATKMKDIGALMRPRRNAFLLPWRILPLHLLTFGGLCPSEWHTGL